MRQNNEKPTRVIWRPIPNSSQEIALDSRADHTLYTGARGPGKCLPIDTLIPTPNGWIEHGNLLIGDKVFGSDGLSQNILNVFEKTYQDVWELTFNDGSKLQASKEHLWKVSIDRGFPVNWREETTDWIISRINEGLPVRLPARSALKQNSFDIGIDPYMLGAWVGDGSAYIRVRKPTGNRTVERRGYIVEFGSNDLELVAAAINSDFSLRRTKNGFTWLLGKEKHKLALLRMDLFDKKSDTKFIPNDVLNNSIDIRIAFLQGLMDTDGTPRKSGGCRLATSSEQLANDTINLVKSLGGFGKISVYIPKIGMRQKLPIYNVDFNVNGFIPFRLGRKVSLYKKPKRLGWFNPKVVSVEYAGKKEVNCIEVSNPDHLYVAGRDYITTRNTDTQLMRFKRNVGMGYGSYWRGIIFDREYKNLDDIVIKSKRWFPAFDDGARFLNAPKDFKWVWPTGEELLFRAAKDQKDYWDYHGQEFPFIGFNELTKYPTNRVYELMKSTNRSSYRPEKDGWVGGYYPEDSEIPVGPNGAIPSPIPLEFFSTANPWGAGHAWVKRQFIDVAKYGKLHVVTTNVFNPQTQQREDITTSQVAIFGSYRENIYLDPKYVADLENNKDVNQRKAWLAGSWDIIAGGAIDDVWNGAVHIIPRFEVPKGFKVDRTLDWGSTKPYSVGWFAEADGKSEVTFPDGKKVLFPRGTIIQIHELYGTKKIGENKGLKEGSDTVAGKIKRQEAYLQGKFDTRVWVKETIFAGPADNQIRDKIDMDEDTIEVRMAKADIHWTESNKSKGSRKIGLQLLRDRLESVTKDDGKPGFYVTDNCEATIQLLPVLPRDEDDPDDIDTEVEDHVWDMIRYRLLAGTRQMQQTVEIEFARG